MDVPGSDAASRMTCSPPCRTALRPVRHCCTSAATVAPRCPCSARRSCSTTEGGRIQAGRGRTGDSRAAVADILARAENGLPSGSGGLVVLASCLTDVTEADYDEALTLATAFLSAGAAGVVAARWRVPEADTALFMIIFHHSA